MLADDAALLHANAHAMRVAWEPVAGAMARIAAAGETLISIRRL